METHIIEADDRLAQVFSHFYVVCQGLDAPTLTQQLLPNYEMLMVVNFGPELFIWLSDESYAIRRVAIIGPLQKVLRYELGANTDLMVIVFTLNGFYRLFGKLLRQPNPSANDVVLEPALLTDLWAQLASQTNLNDRIRCFSEYALKNLAPIDTSMQPLLDTIPHFRRTLLDPIKAVAGQHALSTRTLQLRFQHQLGYSAKEMMRFIRFKKLLAQLIDQQPALPDWSDLVVTLGYHDQSHLIRDVQFYTGLPPTAFVKQLAEQTLCMSKPGKFY